MKLKLKTVAAKMNPANIVPNMIAPKVNKGDAVNRTNLLGEGKNLKMEPLSEEQQEKLN